MAHDPHTPDSHDHVADDNDDEDDDDDKVTDDDLVEADEYESVYQTARLMGEMDHV